MLKLVLVTSLLIALLAAAGGSAAFTSGVAPPRKPGTILVRFADATAARDSLAAFGDRPAGKIGKHVWIVRLRPGALIDSRLAAYEARPGVVYAEPDYIASIDLSTPNDPSYGTQWGLQSTDAAAGWSLYPGSYTSAGGVPIAIVDTGVYAAHADLGSKVETDAGANCLTGTCNGGGSSSDDNGHGTHVAGIAAALTNNGTGVAGVAISSPIIPVKVLDASGNGSYAGVASGIYWAVAHGARVVNMSLGGTGFDQTLCDAVSSSGVLVVAAAGNSGTSQASYPAACPGAIGVAATNSSGGSPSFSNYGSPNVFVSAPGVSIYSTMWPGTSFSGCSGLLYCSLQGTSMAAPFVAGLGGLLFGERPGLTPAAAKVVLAETAQKIGPAGTSYGPDPYGTCAGCSWNQHYGYGQINVQAALAAGTPPQITSFAPGVSATGTSVTISGSGFTGANAVSFGLVSTSFSVDSPTQITATVPAGVAYGRWRVTNPGGTVVSDLVGSAPLPTITGISSQYGAGTPVTIGGNGFTNVTGVTLGFVPVAAYSVTSPTSIAVTLPSGVDYGRFRVKTPLGTGVGATVFTVSGGTAGGLTSKTLIASAGSTVTLTGPDFTGATGVSLGFVAAAFSVDSRTSITATVPVGVSYGRWRVTTPSGTLVSDLIFSVPVPVVTDISALLGAPGATVTISGTDFQDVTGVTLGNVAAASYTVVSPTTIQAVVPAAGLAYGRWRVLSANGTGVSDVVYTVTG